MHSAESMSSRLNRLEIVEIIRLPDTEYFENPVRLPDIQTHFKGFNTLYIYFLRNGGKSVSVDYHPKKVSCEIRHSLLVHGSVKKKVWTNKRFN